MEHQRDIAAVILDLGLPRLNGWETFQRMKEANPKIKVYSRQRLLIGASRNCSAEKGAERVVFKPYEMDDVLAKVSAAIR